MSAVPTPDPAASTEQLTRHLEFMASVLPSRSIDAETGRKRVAVYAAILGRYSDRALAYMSRTACETLEWFPTPKQCLDLLATYRAPHAPQAQALLACRQFVQLQFDDWLAALRDGAPIGDVPERWKRIAVEQGDVRRLADGTFVSRVLYQGPPCPPYRHAMPAPVAAPKAGATRTDQAEPGASAGLV